MLAAAVLYVAADSRHWRNLTPGLAQMLLKFLEHRGERPLTPQDAEQQAAAAAIAAMLGTKGKQEVRAC